MTYWTLGKNENVLSSLFCEWWFFFSKASWNRVIFYLSKLNISIDFGMLIAKVFRFCSNFLHENDFMLHVFTQRKKVFSISLFIQTAFCMIEVFCSFNNSICATSILQMTSHFFTFATGTFCHFQSCIYTSGFYVTIVTCQQSCQNHVLVSSQCNYSHKHNSLTTYRYSLLGAFDLPIAHMLVVLFRYLKIL